MLVHQGNGIFRIVARVHKTPGKIHSVCGVNRATSPSPTLTAVSSPFFPVAITLGQITHAAGFGDRVDNSSRNYGLCEGCFFRSSYKVARDKMESILSDNLETVINQRDRQFIIIIFFF